MLQYAIDEGIIDITYVQEKIEMSRKTALLMKHPYKIWKGKDEKWYTYIPDIEKGRILKKRNSREAIEELIIKTYDTESKKQEINKNKFNVIFKNWRRKQELYGVSSNTLAKYDSDYNRFFLGTDFEKMDIRKITEEDITIFIVSRINELNLKEKAGKALWGYISGVFRSARINKIISDDPCQYVDTKSFFKFYNRSTKAKESRVINDKELKLLLNQLQSDHQEKPNYMPSYAIEFSIYTGLRAGELAGLKWEDILLDKKVIIISRSEKYDRINKEYFISSTKTYKTRTFPISDNILLFLEGIRSLQSQYGCYNGFIFSTASGKAHVKTISECMRNKCIQIGIEVRGVHSIRRTFNSKLRCEGISSTVAAALLGHTEEVNELNYTYDITNMGYKRQIVEKINKEMVEIF